MINRLALCVVIAIAFAACSGGGASAPTVPPATASPSTTPGSTPAAQMFFPLDNMVGYVGDYNGTPGSVAYGDSSPIPVATPDSSLPQCGGSIGTMSDFAAGSARALIPNTIQSSGPAGILAYSFTKNAIGDVYVDGYTDNSLVKHCVTPYVLMRAQATLGDSWTFTDLGGATIVASVIYVGPASFTTPQGHPRGGGITTNYYPVYEVDYGHAQDIYWSPGFGAVEIENLQTVSNRSTKYTATNWIHALNSN